MSNWLFKELYSARYLLLLIVILSVLACLDQSWVEGAYFNRAAIYDGQWWRLWSGHLSHATRYHWVINTLSMLAIYYFFKPYFDASHWLLTLLLIMPGLSLALLWFDHFDVYTGFSGIIQAWISFVLVRSFHESPVFNSLLLALQWGRIIYEQLPGYDVNYMHDLINAAVAINAHLFGASLGVFSGIACILCVFYAKARS